MREHDDSGQYICSELISDVLFGDLGLRFVGIGLGG
jgi:hypothetical protein